MFLAYFFSVWVTSLLVEITVVEEGTYLGVVAEARSGMSIPLDIALE